MTVEGPLRAHTLYRFFRAGEEETLALQGVSMELKAGELVAVTGPSGSGKSTLLACLAGIDEPDGGTVLIAGQRITHQPEPVRARLRARHIGLLFQSANLFEHLTIRQNLHLAQRLARRRKASDVTALLDSVGLAKRSHAYPRELSGGESARAGLALALANDPAVLLADEPTGEIDSATEAQILDLLHSRAHEGVAVLVASHSPAVSAAADRVIRLGDGKVLS
jgi:putative ABC transport system ATP-binding protein